VKDLLKFAKAKEKTFVHPKKKCKRKNESLKARNYY
jgi:hypothetical protein